jgi:hypothetical protein
VTGKKREGRLAQVKLELVTEMLAKSGRFHEAVTALRADWRIDEPPVERVPESERLLPPVLDPPSDQSDVRAAWSHHPHLGLGPAPDEHTVVVRNLERQWQNDLLHALLRGGVPGEYLEGKPPYAGVPPTSTRLLPWLQFAAACVLCDVPPDQAEAFTEVGGVPSLRGVAGGTIPGVIGPREQREREVAAAVKEAIDAKVMEKLWDGRAELADDLETAKGEVRRRFGEELRNAGDQARERAESWLDLNPPTK